MTNKARKKIRAIAAKTGSSYQAIANQRQSRDKPNAKDLTVAGLAELLSSVDDELGHHVLWVGDDGVIHLDLDPMIGPADYQRQLKAAGMKFRYETYVRGNGYVGAEAARDERWVAELHRDITRDWAAARKGYIDF